MSGTTPRMHGVKAFPENSSTATSGCPVAATWRASSIQSHGAVPPYTWAVTLTSPVASRMVRKYGRACTDNESPKSTTRRGVLFGPGSMTTLAISTAATVATTATPMIAIRSTTRTGRLLLPSPSARPT